MTSLFFFLLAQIHVETVSSVGLATMDIYRPGPIAVSDSGIVCLIDHAELNLVFLDRENNIIRKSGRYGQGPGEFQMLGDVRWHPAVKGFVVIDFVNTRLSLWAEDGSLIREYNKLWGATDPIFLGPDQVLHTLDKRSHPGKIPRLVSYSFSQKAADVLFKYTKPVNKKHTAIDMGGPEPTYVNTDWDSFLHYDKGSDFLVVCFSGEERIQILDLSGKPTGISFRPQIRRNKVGDENIAQLIRHAPVEWREPMRKALYVPEYWPSISRMFVDDFDRIWIFGFSENIRT